MRKMNESKEGNGRKKGNIALAVIVYAIRKYFFLSNSCLILKEVTTFL